MAAPVLPPDASGPVLNHDVDSLDAIDQPVLKPFYAKDPATGKYSLRVEGHPAEARLAEFRETNRGQARRVAELEARLKTFEGIDPAEVAVLRTKLKDYEGIDPKQARDALAKPAVDPAKLAETEAALVAEKAAHAQTAFRHAVGWEFLKLGGRPEALDFIASQAATAFTLDAKGQMVSSEFSPTNPSARLTLAEWMLEQARTVAFAFKPSTGGSAATTPRQAGGGDTRKVISNDPEEIGRHLEGLAAGTVRVG